MATTYDKASLVMIPSGYKDDKLYSIKPTDGSGDFTFSRDGAGASPATRVNASGLIEKGRENVLLQSNQFDTTWGPSSGISVTGGQSGYDGSSDAWLLERSDTSARYINQNITLSSAVYSYSVYAKADSVDWLYMWSFNGTGSLNVYFDLANGLVGTQSGTIDANIESIGGGWYRCSMSYNNNITAVRLYPAVADGSTTGGVAPAGVFIQDAQLESGLVATDYIETTTSAVSAGLLGDMPRLDYSGGATCPSLLLEPSRVNLVTQSEYIGSWTSSNVSVTSNNAVSPEGVQNASTLVVSTQTAVQGSGSATITFNGTDNYTISGYFKKEASSQRAQLRIRQSLGSGTTHALVDFNLLDGSIASYIGNVDVVSFNSDWWYVTATSTTIPTGTGRAIVRMNNLAVSTELTIYGIQVEAGSYPTSYIPTYGSASTRGVDLGIKTGISSLIGQTEGTLFLDVSVDGDEDVSYPTILNIDNGTTANRFGVLRNPNDKIHIYMITNSVSQFTADTTQTSGRIKIALAYANNDIQIYVNGSSLYSTSIADIPATDRVSLNRFGHSSSLNTKSNIHQALLFKTRLTNAELAALTA